LPAASAIPIVASSRVPIMRAAFIMNFMLLVPLASLPAVAIFSNFEHWRHCQERAS
jgi:hypothetical protein